LKVHNLTHNKVGDDVKKTLLIKRVTARGLLP
jgi:hypothetical protein